MSKSSLVYIFDQFEIQFVCLYKILSELLSKNNAFELHILMSNFLFKISDKLVKQAIKMVGKNERHDSAAVFEDPNRMRYHGRRRNATPNLHVNFRSNLHLRTRSSEEQPAKNG